MPKDFLLIFRTRTVNAQQAFRQLLDHGQIAFKELYFQVGPAEECNDIFIEHVYLVEGDFSSLSTLKQNIEQKISYDALLLFEHISW